MAGETFSVSVECKICGHATTITNTDEVYLSPYEGKHYQCGGCGAIIPFKLTSIALKHSADVGAYSKITHTITNGAIVSAVSEHIA